MTDRTPPTWPRGMREETAAQYIGLSVTSIRSLRKRGLFPTPVPLTPGRFVFLKDQLDRWLEEKAGIATAEDWPDA